MRDIKLDKKDVFWSFFAQFLSMGAGVITLPFILNKLSPNEIGLNYILLTIGSIVALVDLGFAPQFARNFSYIFSGVQEIRKEGIGARGESINYRLLSILLKTARYIYAIFAVISIVLLIVVGTPYIYKTTNGFNAIPNALIIWVIYSIGVFFQIFFSYYSSMLLGSGLIKEQKFAIIGNKILYIILLIIGLYLGWGLLSVAIAQALSPFWGRFLSYKFFYTNEIKRNLNNQGKIKEPEIINAFKSLWFNSKKTAVMNIGSYAILKFSMFIAGLYLSLVEFASYGLMIQLVGIIGSVSNTFVSISQPHLASLRAKEEKSKILVVFSKALIISYILFIIGSILLITCGNQILQIIRSNAVLPSMNIVSLYCIIIFLEYNHASFASLISTNNTIPFAPASIITGIAVCIGSFIVLYFTNWGILGLIVVQGICQLAYQNWKWPLYSLKEFDISYYKLIKIGVVAIVYDWKRYFKNGFIV